MTERATAQQRLHRLLYVLPAASRDNGALLSQLAEDLDVEPSEVLRDLEEATSRVFYHPAGSVDAFTILIEGDAADASVRIRTTEFKRPTRLTPREALALVLGLRAMAADASSSEERSRALVTAAGMESALTTPSVSEAEPAAGHDPAEAAPVTDAGIDARIADAAVRGLACRIRYLKPGDAPGDRVIEPWHLVHALGRWYVLGRDPARDDEAVRFFRCDRILSAEILEDRPFVVPEDFDAAAYVSKEGAPFFALNDEEVVVRYSPPASRLAAEAANAELDADGTVALHHRVGDRAWLIRHVLCHGGAAEVIEPEALRAEVARAARRAAGP